MSAFWSGKRVVVTGGSGFLGSRIVDRLRQVGCGDIFVPRSREYDLRESKDIDRLFSMAKPSILIHAAATAGGIGANRASPGRFFYDNAIMGIQLMEYARRAGLDKFVTIGTVCSYPKFTPVPFQEKDLWKGYPEETNAPYGLAKKMLLVQQQAYRQQYGFRAIHLLLANLYGPGDNFDLQTSHVIPALMIKCLNAKKAGQTSVEVWGTGAPTREFLFVLDAAEAIVLAAERYDSPEPLNIGTGEEISIRDLATRVAKTCGFTGTFRWNPEQPDGQPKRRLDTSRIRETLGVTAATSLEQGLQKTLAWLEAEKIPR